MAQNYSRYGIIIEKLQLYNPRDRYKYFVKTSENIKDCPKFTSRTAARKYIEENLLGSGEVKV